MGDDNAELADMNDRQRDALERMKAVFEPVRGKLDELGVTWEYMTWLVGIDSGIGRMKVRVNRNSGLYLVKGHSPIDAETLSKETGMIGTVVRHTGESCAKMRQLKSYCTSLRLRKIFNSRTPPHSLTRCRSVPEWYPAFRVPIRVPIRSRLHHMS